MISISLFFHSAVSLCGYIKTACIKSGITGIALPNSAPCTRNSNVQQIIRVTGGYFNEKVWLTNKANAFGCTASSGKANQTITNKNQIVFFKFVDENWIDLFCFSVRTVAILILFTLLFKSSVSGDNNCQHYLRIRKPSELTTNLNKHDWGQRRVDDINKAKKKNMLTKSS